VNIISRSNRMQLTFALVLSVACSFPLSGDTASGETRSDVLLPALSFFLPGIGQAAYGEYGPMATYTGAWLGGGLMAAQAAEKIKDRKEDEDADSDLNSRDNDVRRAMLGNQIAMASGSFSLFDTFRNASDGRREDGQYAFLATRERTKDVLLAPFRFDYLSRPTTLVPLGIISALAVYIANSDQRTIERVALRGSDYAFGASFSYLAGTHEEALFRGWLMPVLTEYVSADTTANVVQSVLFAAAHLGSTPLPLPQLLLGWHLGYVTLQNDWSLGEAAFIHTWWDVVAFLGIQFAIRSKEAEDETKKGFMNRGDSARGRQEFSAMLRQFPLMLPPVSISF
jgi:membrane protease YdiL (CAAX protease family)